MSRETAASACCSTSQPPIATNQAPTEAQGCQRRHACASDGTACVVVVGRRNPTKSVEASPLPGSGSAASEPRPRHPSGMPNGRPDRRSIPVHGLETVYGLDLALRSRIKVGYEHQCACGRHCHRAAVSSLTALGTGFGMGIEGWNQFRNPRVSSWVFYGMKIRTLTSWKCQETIRATTDAWGLSRASCLIPCVA